MQQSPASSVSITICQLIYFKAVYSRLNGFSIHYRHFAHENQMKISMKPLKFQIFISIATTIDTIEYSIYATSNENF